MKLKHHLFNVFDEWCVHDAAGGNLDDAYQLGFENGEASTLDCIKFILDN